MDNIASTSILLTGIATIGALSMSLILKCIWSKLTKSKTLVQATTNNDSRNEAVKSEESEIPLSVNYHFTRKCNYECKFCFHQAKTSFHLPIDEAKRGIRMLVEAGIHIFVFRLICSFRCHTYIHMTFQISDLPKKLNTMHACMPTRSF